MKKLLVMVIIALVATACSSTKNTANSDAATVKDGSSFSKAILIKEKTETNGVAAEYQWIKDHYAHAAIKGQRLVDHDNKPYDIIKILTIDDEEKEIYFDISNFFGKM